MTLHCFQSENVTLRDQLQEKVAEMESFAGHLEEIFLTVEVNVTFKRLTLTGQCEHLEHFFYCFIEVQDVRFHFCNWKVHVFPPEGPDLKNHSLLPLIRHHLLFFFFPPYFV